MFESDTIAAIATGAGEAGVAMIRLSGPQAVEVGARCFRPLSGKGLQLAESHRLVYGQMIDPLEQRVLDEGLVAVMRGPRSYTGEDVVELYCHGGRVVTGQVLEATLKAGARLAEPGEYTKRAFLNGRLDLSQAEAVIDLIRSKTSRAAGASLRQLEGQLSEQIGQLRHQLLGVLAHLEADIDFPEENLEVAAREAVLTEAETVKAQIEQLLAGARAGRILREGLHLVIVGRPNVGKSSLLNRLVGADRAIVTEIPGTTRDLIEEQIQLEGVPLVLVDTAGLRETEDPVEQLGVERSRARLEQADLVLTVIDGSAPLSEADEALLREVADRPGLIVVNKLDLATAQKFHVEQRLRELAPGLPVVGVSARTGLGFDELSKRLVTLALGKEGLSEDWTLVTRARHQALLEAAKQHLEAALEAAAAGLTSDFLSIDLRAAWEHLGEITGETASDDLVDRIFAEFCIGK